MQQKCANCQFIILLSSILQSNTLWFFNDELCHSMPLTFEKEIIQAKIPGYRFVPRIDVFTAPQTTPENKCFCIDEPLCDMVGDGMFPVAKCQMGTPIILSWPHFLHAGVSYQHSVTGLNPDKQKHGFYFDIQQVSDETYFLLQLYFVALHTPSPIMPYFICLIFSGDWNNNCCQGPYSSECGCEANTCISCIK